MKFPPPPLPHWGNQNWELKQFTQGYPPHQLQVKGGESSLKCKADECQSPFPSMPLTGEQWKMRVVMTCMSLSGEMKRTMEEGVHSSCCLSRNGWWVPEERNGIHHGATSWSQYENFKEPGNFKLGSASCCLHVRESSLPGRTNWDNLQTPTGGSVAGHVLNVSGSAMLTLQGICFREYSLRPQRVNHAKWYIHLSNLLLLKTCCWLSILPHSTNMERMPVTCQSLFSAPCHEH